MKALLYQFLWKYKKFALVVNKINFEVSVLWDLSHSPFQCFIFLFFFVNFFHLESMSGTGLHNSLTPKMMIMVAEILYKTAD